MINTCTLLYFSHTNLSVIIWTSVWLFSFIQSNIQISTYLIIEIYIINSIYIFSLKLTLISLQHQIIQKLCLIFNHDYILKCNNNLTRFRRFVKRNYQTLLEKSHTLQFHVRTFFYCILRLFSSSEGGSARADHVPQRRCIHWTNSIIYISLWYDTLVTRMRRILTKCRFVGKCRIFIANSISVCNLSIRVKRF